jgi:hypothetical protein
MNTKINDGGPAFARDGFGLGQMGGQEGMSVRAWLAGMAMQGLCAGMNHSLSNEMINRMAVELADGQIAELAKIPIATAPAK